MLFCDIPLFAVGEIIKREVARWAMPVCGLSQPILKRLFWHLLPGNTISMLYKLSCSVIVQVQWAFHAHRERCCTLEESFLVELRPELLPVWLRHARLTVCLSSSARAIGRCTILLHHSYVIHRASMFIIFASPTRKHNRKGFAQGDFACVGRGITYSVSMMAQRLQTVYWWSELFWNWGLRSIETHWLVIVWFVHSRSWYRTSDEMCHTFVCWCVWLTASYQFTA